MKNIKLLLVTTAILSMGAMTANAVLGTTYGSADIGNTKIHAEATLITSLTITESQRLDFGGIINPQNNQVVVVNSSGELGAGTTAQVVKYSSALAGYEGVNANVGIKPGKITVTGGYLHTIADGSPAAADKYSITFPTSITLKSGDVTCGIVDQFSGGDAHAGYNADNDEITYGGTFTLDSNIASHLSENTTMKCVGEGTVTLVYSDFSLND